MLSSRVAYTLRCSDTLHKKHVLNSTTVEPVLANAEIMWEHTHASFFPQYKHFIGEYSMKSVLFPNISKLQPSEFTVCHLSVQDPRPVWHIQYLHRLVEVSEMDDVAVSFQFGT